MKPKDVRTENSVRFENAEEPGTKIEPVGQKNNNPSQYSCRPSFVISQQATPLEFEWKSLGAMILLICQDLGDGRENSTVH